MCDDLRDIRLILCQGLVHSVSWCNKMPLICVQTVVQCQNFGFQCNSCLPQFAFKPRLILDLVVIMTFLTLLKPFDHYIYSRQNVIVITVTISLKVRLCDIMCTYIYHKIQPQCHECRYMVWRAHCKTSDLQRHLP